MPRVICTLPNASNLISGVKFESHDDGMISEEISDEQAEWFLSIPGYLPDAEGSKGNAKATADDEAEIEALRARAEELGVKVNPRWKQERLTAEVEKAEAAKAAEDAAAATGDAAEQF